MKDNRPLHAGGLVLVRMAAAQRHIDKTWVVRGQSCLKLWAMKQMIQSSFQNSHGNRTQVNHILYIKRFLSWFSANCFFISQSCFKCPHLLFCALVTSPHSAHLSFSAPSHHLRFPGRGFENSLCWVTCSVCLCWCALILPSTHYTS